LLATWWELAWGCLQMVFLAPPWSFQSVRFSTPAVCSGGPPAVPLGYDLQAPFLVAATLSFSVPTLRSRSSVICVFFGAFCAFTRIDHHSACASNMNLCLEGPPPFTFTKDRGPGFSLSPRPFFRDVPSVCLFLVVSPHCKSLSR